MKTYEAVYEKDNKKGVFGISLVRNPAMEGKFLKLAKHQEVKLQSVDDEKRILLGLVLEPNKLIYRNQDGEEFNITFSEETIKDLAYNFQKEGYQNNSSLEHDKIIQGVTFVESWTVEDVKLDKQSVYGLSYPKGSWLAMMRVESDEVWNEYVKTGDVQGFSVDAMVELKEVNTIEMSDIKTEDEKFFNKIKELFFSALGEKPKEVKLGEVKSDDGAVTFFYEGDVIEPNKTIIWTQDENGQRVDLPAGDYKTEDGKTIVLVDGGVVSEVKEMQPTDEKKEVENLESDAPAPQPQGDFTSEQLNTIKSMLVKFVEDTKAEVKEVNLAKEKTIEDLKIELAEVKKTVLEFAERPAVEKRVSQPTQTVGVTAKSRITNALKK